MIDISTRSGNNFILPVILVQRIQQNLGNNLHLHSFHAFELSKEPNWEQLFLSSLFNLVSARFHFVIHPLPLENCQMGVFLLYVTARSHTLIDRELYLPLDWCEDRPRCQAAHVPEAMRFQTKPQLAIQMEVTDHLMLTCLEQTTVAIQARADALLKTEPFLASSGLWLLTSAAVVVVLPAAFSRPSSRCDPGFFRPPLLHCFCADDTTTVACSCRERQCPRKRQASNVWTWLKSVSAL